jgi:molybdopterin molybdotransferase
VTDLLELEDAQSRLLRLALVGSVEHRSVVECLNYYLAEPVFAGRTQPAADLSVMDGYAVGAGMQGTFRLVGSSAAGRPFRRQLAADEAVRIATGAVVPSGTRSVWPQEICHVDGRSVTLCDEAPNPPNSFIRYAGSDFQLGDCLLEAGEWIGPAAIALAIMASRSTLPVHRKPRIAVMQTGDELVDGSQNLEHYQIPACNGTMVGAMLGALPCSVRLLATVPDRLDALVQSFSSCEDAEVIVTIGGASVGDHDLVREALMRWGAVPEFWRVAIKPGKPLLVAKRGPQIVLGLPGNPASAFVTAFLFLLPLVRHMLGAAYPLPILMQLPLGCDLPAGGSRREFLRARLQNGFLQLAGSQHSSAVRGLAQATHLIDRPSFGPPATIGSTVRCYSLLHGIA